jgi:hypothetical protein
MHVPCKRTPYPSPYLDKEKRSREKRPAGISAVGGGGGAGIDMGKHLDVVRATVTSGS